MKRRSFLQLMGLTSLAIAVNPVESLLPEAILEESVPDLWCKLANVDISRWLESVSLGHEMLDTTKMGDVARRYVPGPSYVDLRLLFPDDDCSRNVVYDSWVGAKNATLEFGDRKKRVTYKCNVILQSIEAHGSIDDPVKFWLRARTTSPVIQELA